METSGSPAGAAVVRPPNLGRPKLGLPKRLFGLVSAAGASVDGADVVVFLLPLPLNLFLPTGGSGVVLVVVGAGVVVVVVVVVIASVVGISVVGSNVVISSVVSVDSSTMF